MQTTQQIVDIVQQHGKIQVAITDIDGILRGKIMHANKFISAIESGFGFCDVAFGWDMADVAYNNVTYTGWHTGYPDAPVKLDLDTFRTKQWDNNLPFMLGDVWANNQQTAAVCPRNLLKKIREKALNAGFFPYFSQEFEWFNFNETPQTLHDKHFKQPQPITPGMFGYSLLRTAMNTPFFNDLFDLLGSFGIPLEGLHTETGPGVYEAAIMYAPVLEAADRAVLFKAMTKEIGHLHQIMPTFMAKWNENLPGCSGHVHQSLWNTDRTTNLFASSNNPQGMSQIMQSYLAGQLYCLPHLLPMYAPTINSYKRLVEGAWAPTTLTWAIDNRTVALRALTNNGAKSTRIETRVVGSDSNPYLAMAACLASGLYGIEQNMQLNVPATIGNGYKNETNGTLPRNLWDATQAMKQSEVVHNILGDEFVTHFTQTREWEWQQYAKVVTDWELKRYFETV